ncbi:hypothetical protein [Paraburkholderia flagellata]|uniref:hypothetical protein n=1 Tax=Paraburkholderia flagellata TaxID=2883241 RepID=UPI001F44E172|nr:hypothetical protein [Paraburkholderia flagellata]
MTSVGGCEVPRRMLPVRGWFEGEVQLQSLQLVTGGFQFQYAALRAQRLVFYIDMLNSHEFEGARRHPQPDVKPGRKHDISNPLQLADEV